MMADKPVKSSRLPEYGSRSIFNRSEMNEPLCSICLNLGLDTVGGTSTKKVIRLSYFEAVESSLIGCRFCSLICRGLKTVGAQITESSCIVTVSATRGTPFYVSWDDRSSQRAALELFASPGANTSIPELGSASEIDTDPASDASFDLIKTWLTTCESRHPRCKNISDGTRPHRLVDVGAPDQACSPKLVEEYPKDAPYVALSHCWGTGNTFKTNHDNLEELKKGIDWLLLPKTFQDAILVTRRLGFQYVWIDTLCIVQDNSHDWDVESAIMGSIYEGSYLTIAASTSSSDQHGFLEDAKSRYAYLSCDLYWDDSSLPSGIKVRNIHDARDRFDEEPLSTRAWTFQERLLPRRLLTYSTALMWECADDWCECGSGLFPDPFFADSVDFYFPSRQKYRELLCWNAEKDWRVPYQYWNVCVVAPYMDRRITNESDCLPAISAIASKVQAATGDQYLAGLWKTDLARGLTWSKSWSDREYRRSGGQIHRGKKTTEYRAPSWSWASCHGSVSFWEEHNMNESHVNILEAECVPKGLNAFGEVKSGFLRLSGKTTLAWLMGKTIYLLRDGDIENDMTPSFSPDTPLIEADGVDSLGQIYRTAHRAGISPDEQPEDIAAQVLCLLVSGGNGGLGHVRHFIVLGGLSSPPGTYERVGILSAFRNHHPAWYTGMADQEVIIF